MKIGLAVVAIVAFACSSLFAQVTPGYSSVTSSVELALTGDNGSDSDIAVDDQSGSTDALSVLAVAGFSNSNGVFDGAADGNVEFIDSASGSFMGSSSFSGSDSGLPGAMGSFQHTLSSEYEYQFMIDGDGTIDIAGILTNSSTVFESFARITLSSESTVGGGFVGSFFDEIILDTQNSGVVEFSHSVPLTASSGSYRMRISVITSGVGQRDQDPIHAAIDASFQIHATVACPADLNGDGVLDFFDVSAFLTAFNSMDPVADLTGDGVFDFFDVSAFLSAFGSGCP